MKKKSILKVLLLTLLACCLAFALVACGGTTYTVTYDYNDGGATQSTTIEVDEGSLLEEPTAPTRDGYTFDGWFNGDAEWTFATDTVTGDITLTAHWTQNVTPPPAHTHTYGDYTVTTAPTESAAGVATATCSGCEEGTEGHATTMALPMLTAENIVSSATDGKYTVATTPATCTAAGSSVYTYHYDGDKTLVAATVTLDKLEHTYGDYTVTTAPTADAAGVATATCSVCAEGTEGHTTTMTLPALTEENIAAEAADGKYTVATTPATCAADGSSVYTYHYDGDKTLVAATVTLDKLGHTYGDYTVTTAPTEDAAGVATATCSVCAEGTEGHTTTMTLPALTEENIAAEAADGKYTVATTAATCTAAGSSVYTYHYDGDKTLVAATVTLDKLEHTWGEWTVETLPAIDGSTEGAAVRTCTRANCGAEDELTLPKIAFGSDGSPTNYAVGTSEDPTCQKEGYGTLTYTVPEAQGGGTIELRYTLDKLEHTYGDYTVTTAPTESAAGVATATCSVCAEGTEGHTTTMTLPALTEENIVSSAADGKYTVATTAATCTAAGSSVYTYHYNGDKTLVAATVSIPMAAHSYKADVVLKDGTYTITGSCSTCETINETATLTLEKGEEGATGTAPKTLDVTFDGTSFTVTLPENPFAYDGYAFTGWSDGKQTLSGTITLKADDSVTLTAQWALVTEVRSEEELREALSTDTEVITIAESFEISAPITISRAVTIDLNDKELTFTGDGTQLTIQGTESEEIKVTLRNGSIEFTTTANVTSTCIAINLANVTIDDVNITTGTSAIFPAVATLTVKNSTITAFTYGIGTNASVKVEQDGTTKEVFGPVNLTIENSIVKTTDKDSTAVLFNVEGSLAVTDSALEGGRQGLILRKGIATITGGSITSRWEYANKDQYIPEAGAQAAWRTGNEVPMAAIVIGDTGKNYNGDAILTISGTEVKLGNTDATRYIYLWADTTDKTAAQLIYACGDAYMPALAEAGKIVRGNDAAEVTVTHAALTHYDATEATCTEAGMKEHYFCDVCDTYFDSAKEPTTAEALVISALGHTYGEWTVTTNPSESAAGVATITCSVCAEGTEGHTQSVTLPELTAENVAEEATAGKYTVVETKATCEAEGSTVYTYHFMFDGELTSLELPEIKHEQLEHVWNVTYDGTTLTASCPNGCGDSYTATLTLTGTGATVALGEAATFTVADGFAIDLSKLSVTKEEADVIRAYIANGSIVTGTQTVAANGTLALEVVVEDTSFTVGSLQTDAWSTPVWSDVLYPGEVITITGQHTSNAVTGNNNGFAMLALLYSGNIVWGAYRPDNYIIGGDDKGGSETVGVYYDEEGIQVDKVPTITWTSDGGTTFDVFQNVLANCTYTVTYNWAYETVIYVTITMEGTYNDTPYTNVSSYVVQASEGNTLKDWYRIGLTCAQAMYTNVSVTVHSEHEYVDNVCTVCGTYAPTLNLSVSQGDVTYTSTLNHIDVYKNNDTDPTWDGNGTSDLIDATGDFAITMFWENTRDVNYYDFRLNPVFNNGGIQLWEGDSSFDNYASGSEPTKSISITNSAGEVTTIPAAGTVNCGAGSYRAEIYRIGDVLTMKVYFTPATDSIQAWTITAVYTGVSENDCTVCMAGNPFWLDNIHAYYGTLTAQS